MSMYSIGMSGLLATEDALDVVSNNISNSSTAGFKSSSTAFSAVYTGSQAGGVDASTVTQSFDSEGSLESTSDDLDLAISGSGFFVINDGTSTAYTRNGEFSVNSSNEIVTSSGWNVQGYGVNSEGELDEGELTDLKVSSTTMEAKASTTLSITSNLNSSASTISSTFSASDSSTYNYSVSSSVYDSQGGEHTLDQYYVKTGTNAWSVYYAVDGTTLTDSSGADVTTSLTFNTDGSLASPTSASSLDIPVTGANDISLSISYSNFTQYSSDFSTTTNSADGYTSGTLSSTAFDDNGYLYATYSNGEKVLEGQAVIATFVNVDGLTEGDGTTWYATTASGNAIITTAGSGTAGTLSAGYYEDSNVDVSSQLVDLMSLQRNYEANAKVLSSASTLDSALFNAMS